MSLVKWLPLESNPDIINVFLEKLGVPDKWRVSDLLSLEDEYLSMVSNSVLAALLLFPFSENDNKYCKEQKIVASMQETDSDIYFMCQSVNKACGTVALIHAIANNLDELNMKSHAVIKRFIDKTKHLAPKDKAEVFKYDKDIGEALAASCEQGQDLGDECHFHFLTLIQKSNKLYELDDRKTAPVFHGFTTQGTFVKDCAHVCKKFINRDPNNLNFSVLLFAAA